MGRRRTSSESTRSAGQDFSMLAAAAVLVILSYAVSQHVVPNYHELKALEQRRDGLRAEVAKQRQQNAETREEIEALDDPYYVAWMLVKSYGWRYPELQLERARDE